MRTLAIATALTVALVSTPAASADPTTLSLPAPTGRQPVGVTSLYMKDTARPDPWVESVPYRELMVSVFYPTAATHGAKKQYMTPTESERYMSRLDLPDIPLDVMSTVRTSAVVDARPTGRRHSAPFVVLSPGWTQPRATLTSWAEDLASHGYVVAVIDHTYENRAQTFPDGRVTDCAACEVDDLPGFWEKMAQGRAADTSFVLDQLTRSKKFDLIDPKRIGMTGHSAGGAITTQAMLADSRIRAGIDVDGSVHVPIPDSGLSRPFMFMGSTDFYVPGQQGPYDDWETDWQHLTGWKRWIMSAGTVHASYTDLGVLADQLGIDLDASVSGERAVAITRAYVRAFFDLHLRCKPQPLMAAPSPAYPEVTFVG
jgi:dienelactone hydrolase